MREMLSTLMLALPALALTFAASPVIGANYDESKVPEYTLPDPLESTDGEVVRDAETWWNERRGEVLRLFQEHVYGEAPARPEGLRFEVLEESSEAFDGRAIRKQVRIYFNGEDGGPYMDLLVYLPRDAEGPVPVFLGLNFNGNVSVEDDPEIIMTDQWRSNDKEDGIVNNTPSEKTRGEGDDRWPVEQILRRGYGVATACYEDIDPDRGGHWEDGVHPLFYENGQKKPAAEEWGSIGAWAWGLSRAMDYLQSDEDVDNRRVAVMGHSRLGKTALWAGARDPRFALVVSNCSGCGGAALSRRAFGETVKRINTSFPHWFCDTFTKYNDSEGELPVDQHMLVSLIAPRPVLVNSAKKDRWADPKGEFLSAKHAGPVYELLGETGIERDSMPGLNHLLKSTAGYHIRPGGHGVTPADWQVFMDFADHHWRR